MQFLQNKNHSVYILGLLNSGIGYCLKTEILFLKDKSVETILGA